MANFVAGAGVFFAGVLVGSALVKSSIKDLLNQSDS